MPDRTPLVIRTDIDRARDDLTRTLDEVVNHRLSVPAQVTRHPKTFIVACAAAGTIFGLLLGALYRRFRAKPQPRILIRI